MIHRSGRRFRRGNAVLEAALVLPVLLYLAFGTVEFGYFFYVKSNLQGAARQGARAAITAGATNSDVNTSITNAMNLYGLQNCGYSITTSPANISSAVTGTDVSVTVQCTWGAVGVRPMQIMSASKVVKAAAVMRKEG